MPISPKQIVRVEVESRKADQLRGALREMLSGYPFLGSLASSDSIAYHGVRTDQFRWLATDGVSIMLNDTPDGFFSNPGYTPVPDMPADVASATGLTPGQTIAPNPNSNQQPMNDDERVFGVAHEILHVACEDVLWAHVYRQQGWVPVPKSADFPDGRAEFDEEALNDAMDARINAGLKADGVGKPPERAFFHPSITWETPREDAYAIVWGERKGAQSQPPPPPPQPGQGGPPPQPPGGQGQQPPPPPPPQGQGPGQPPQGPPNPSKKNQGAGDILQPGQGGDPWSDSTDPTSPDTQPGNANVAASEIEAGRAEREAMVKRAESVARQMGAGSSAIEQMVRKAREPDVDWREYVHGFLSRAGGVSAWDWKRPYRPPLLRDDPYFQPARGGHGVGTIVLWQDTSGSIGEKEHRVFLGVVAEMLGALRPKRLIIGFCDTLVQRVDDSDDVANRGTGAKLDGYVVDVGDDFANYNIPKGGGTSLVPPFEWTTKHLTGEDKPDAMIYLTDFYGNAPAEAPDYPVLWCIVGGRTSPLSGARFGEVIPIPVSELQE